MNLKRFGFIIYVCSMLVASAPLFSQADASGQVSFSIQFFDEKIYYQNDEIVVKATLTNNSPTAYRFRLADNRLFSLDFDIRDLSNLALKPSEAYTTVLSDNKPVYARDVTILPGEDFSFNEILSNYKQLPSGVYVVGAQFFPELRGQSAGYLQSNNLTLSIRPAVRKADSANETVNLNLQQALKAENLPPDQVVKYTLDARMRDQAEAFFLYLDVERLYKNEPRRGEALRRMSETEHMEAIKKFKAKLWSMSIDDPISLKSTSYEIMRTNYGGNAGTVDVVLKFKNSFFTERRQYRYQLERQNEVWKIVSYAVTKLANE